MPGALARRRRGGRAEAAAVAATTIPEKAPVAKGDGGAVAELAGHSRTVLIWTVVSRLTGFLRVATLAAVLGPTFFGNLFQTALTLPYIVGQLLTASLMTAILAPYLVHHLERGDGAAAKRLACGVFGTALLLFTLAGIAAALAAPLIVPVMTMAVDSPAVRAEQFRLGWPLLVVLAPQVPFYGIAAVGMAVQQAHRRFALSTAAPALENLAMVAVLGLTLLLFGMGDDVGAVSMAQVLLLGSGATLAVGLHAAAQWWGAHRTGITLIPRVGWRDPEVRRVMRMVLPSSANAGLMSLTTLALLIAAGRVPGGAVAFQVAYNLFNLPIALCARPIAAAQLPLLARQNGGHDGGHDGGAGGAAGRAGARRGGGDSSLYQEGLRLTLFVALPACLTFVFLPDLLASLVAFGDMRGADGIGLMTAAIAGLGLGIFGQSVLVVATSAAYARHDATSPLYAILIQTGVVLAGLLPVSWLVLGPARLFALGLLFSAATVVAGLYLQRRQRRPGERLLERARLGDLAAAGLAVLAGVVVVQAWPQAWMAGMAAPPPGLALLALSVSGVLYLALQYGRGSAQLGVLIGAVRWRERP